MNERSGRTGPAPHERSDAIEMAGVSRTILRRWVLVLGAAALAATVGYAMSERADPVFEASTSVLVGRNVDQAGDAEATRRLALTLADTVRRRPVLEGTVRKLDLDEPWERLRRRVSVELVPETQIVVVTVRAGSRPEAELITATIANRFILFSAQLTSLEQVIIEPAHADPQQASPNVRLNTLIAGALGFLAASGIALLVEYRPGRRRRGSSELLADVPQLGRVRTGHGLVAFTGPHTGAAEAYGRVLTNLHVVLGGRSARVVLVARSPAARHGEEVATNVAAMLALTGARTILVDAGLRHPEQHRILGAKGGPGVADHLARRDGSPAALLQSTPVPHLYLLAAGTPGQNLSILFSPGNLERLLSDLDDHADVLVIDSAFGDHPAETVLLARLADAVVLVGRTGRLAGLDERTATELEEGGLRVTGVLTVGGWRRPSTPALFTRWLRGRERGRRDRRRRHRAGTGGRAGRAPTQPASRALSASTEPRSEATLAAGPGAETPLRLVVELCQALEEEKILYCHWKSNEAIDRSANGENDLDLLIERADAPSFATVIARLGFKEAR
ncbi:MAG: hypothetical protein M3R01_11365, partial [Actinomycetota bacterium]|nr:hypothetical protein [Actinomycetota bacterium]